MPTKPNRADYAPNRNGESAYRSDLRAYEAALVLQQYGPRPTRSEFPTGRGGSREYNIAQRNYGTDTKLALPPLEGLADIRGSVTPGSMEPAPTNLGEGIQMQIAERSRAGAGYPEGVVRPNYYPVTTYSGSAPAPNGDGLGTQTSPRQATPDEMFAFLGAMRNTPGADAEEIARGRSNLATFARPFADLVTETEIEAPELDISVDDMQAFGKSAEDIATRMTGDDVEVLIDENYEPNKGMATTEDINKAMRARQKRLNDERTRKQEMEKIESAPKSETAPQSDDKTDYMVALMSPEQKRRTAFLDAPDSMSGLKRREMMRGYITAGGQKYAITPEFIKSGDAKDLGPVLTSQQVAQAKAQELLDNTVENVIKSPAVTQTPMLGEVEPVFEGLGPAFGKVSKVMPENEGIFVENNATEFDLGQGIEKMSVDYNYPNRYPNMVRR